jgi:ATP-dependent exoDNAse (exonuclease V) alpha subunit
VMAVKGHLAKSPETVMLGRRGLEFLYTTREMIALETKMLSTAKELQQGNHLLRAEVLVKGEFSTEQKKALLHIVEEKGDIKVVSGWAGTGKTMLLGQAREAWEASGYKVIGCSFTGKAARGLEEGAGIKSDTIHKLLFENNERGFAKQEERTPTAEAHRRERYQLDKNTILVMDEAGMVGTRQMAAVVELARKSDAKLILVGDAKQLQPIAAGAPFRAIAERVGQAELKEIIRQRDSRDVQAIKDIVAGSAEKALRSYAERGLLTVSETRRDAMAALIIDWKKEAAKSLKDTLIVTGTRLEATILNRKAQEERLRDGVLGDKNIAANGERLYENDRVIFTRKSRLYQVENGNLGTVEQIDERRKLLTVRLDDERRVTVSLQSYDHIKLGYAATTHKFQGVTAERCFVLGGGDMQDRELSYVQASRARGETKIYIERSEAGNAIATLAHQMNKSRQKEMAIEVAHYPQEELRGKASQEPRKQPERELNYGL